MDGQSTVDEGSTTMLGTVTSVSPTSFVADLVEEDGMVEASGFEVSMDEVPEAERAMVVEGAKFARTVAGDGAVTVAFTEA